MLAVPEPPYADSLVEPGQGYWYKVASWTDSGAGPLDGDDRARWAGPPRIVNTGCWVNEPVLLARSKPPHPYWPGGCVRIGDDGVPRAMSLHAPAGH